MAVKLLKPEDNHLLFNNVLDTVVTLKVIQIDAKEALDKLKLKREKDENHSHSSLCLSQYFSSYSSEGASEV